MLKTALFAATALVAAAPASAAIIYEKAPTGSPTTLLVNQGTGQNFAMRFTLATAQRFGGVGIYTSPDLAGSFALTSFFLRRDNNGEPGSLIQSTFGGTDSVTPVQGYDPSQVVLATMRLPYFAITLQPGTYWITMSGQNADNLGIWGFGDVAAYSDQRVFSGYTLVGTPTIGSLAFQLNDGFASVPEPASWALMITGFGLAGTAARRRKPVLA